MLVDDKLAKEKLARICEDEAAVRRHRHDHPLEGDNPMVQAHKHVTAIKLAQLIRNTDLTDCQPPMEDCSVTQAQVPPSFSDSGTEVQHCCGLSGFNPMLGDTCPRCELNSANAAWEARRGPD